MGKWVTYWSISPRRRTFGLEGDIVEEDGDGSGVE